MPNLATNFARLLVTQPDNSDLQVRYDQPLPTSAGGFPASVDNFVVSSAGEAGTVTLPAPPVGQAWQFAGLWWSYSDTPTGGNILVKQGSTTLMNFDVTAGGPGFIGFPAAWTILDNTTLVLTIADGGGVLVGKAGFLQVQVVPVESSGGEESDSLIIPGL